MEDIPEYTSCIKSIGAINSSINESSNDGAKLIKGVLTSTQVDLYILVLLAKNQLSDCEMNQQAWDDYLKHIKRSFIQDVWSVTESKVRDIVSQKNFEIEGRSQKANRYIKEALELNDDHNVAKLLKKAKNATGGQFIEFPVVLSALLRDKFDENQIKEWRGFFDLLRIMRNASHNNFRVMEDKTAESKWISKVFVSGKSVQFWCTDIPKIVEGLVVFFEAVENAA